MLDDCKFSIPRHLAIIMDGNGRWAKNRGKPRSFGHKNGAEAFKRIVDATIELSVPFVTFYAFSTENWNRPKLEVKILFELFNQYLDEFIEIGKRNARLNFIGDIDSLDKKVANKMKQCMELTRNNTGTTVSIAINYGGRDEIYNAVKSLIAKEVHDISITDFEECLYTHNLPDVDLLIRTGGEQRISNFLLWKLAYAELIFLDVLWPDFNKENLISSFKLFSQKDRRFGGLK